MAYATPVVAVGASPVTTSNLTSAVFDGVTVTNGQRVLLIAQASAVQNGVWIFNGTGSSHPMTRPTGTDEYATTVRLDNSTLIPATGGTTYGGTCWGIDPAQIITVDTTAHTLTQVALPPVQAAAASTGNLSSLASVTTLDGVTLVGNGAQGSNIVLLKDQSTASANGLYWAYPTGTMVRCTEPLTPARKVQVSGGTVNAHTEWLLNTAPPITVGTTSIGFSRQILRANPRDYGAKSDGSTDDSSAIATAIAAVLTGTRKRRFSRRPGPPT